MKENSAHFSPKIEPLAGSVHAEWGRCNRPGCRCARGELHGPYYRRFWCEGGRTHSAYVRLVDVEAVRARCARHQQIHMSRRAFRRLVRDFDALSDAVLDALLAARRGGHDRPIAVIETTERLLR